MGDILSVESLQWNRTMHNDTLREADAELAGLVDTASVDAEAIGRVRQRLQDVMRQMEDADPVRAGESSGS